MVRKRIFRFMIAAIFGVFITLSSKCLDLTASATVTCDIPVSYKISSQTLSSGTTATSSTELYLYPGDIVYFNFSYTPSSSSVSFGLLTPSGTFRTITKSTGSCVYTMVINEEGVHKFRMKNNSSSSVTVTGTYSTGCSYPFRGSQIATTISQDYSSSHYGLDITESTSGAINGYSIYSIGKGTVKVAGYSSSAGYYVAVVGSGGYTTRYLHMKSSPSVSSGNSVTYSTLLGYVGNSGDSSGYHLHIDVNTVGATSGGSGSSYVNYSTTISPKTLFPQITFT